jgi:hypothetical protein
MAGSGEDLVNAVVSLVQDAPPLQVARRTLQFLSRMFHCACAVAYRANGDDLEMLSGFGVDQAAIDAVYAAWRAHRIQLQAGERIQTANSATVPLLAGEELTGILFLRSDTRLASLTFQQFTPLCGVLANLCRSPLETPIPDGTAAHLTAPVPQDVERDHLVSCLEQHEWNLARVARAKGVTRPTIYAWLQRLGIERKRVHLASGYALRRKA